MKRAVFLAIPLGAAAFLLLMGCPTAKVTSTLNCTECHNGDTATGQALLGAEAQYQNSGHYNGPRTANLSSSPGTSTVFTGYEFDGSDAMYSNGSSCSRCHTDQGFVSYVSTGTTINVSAASQPGCFTCHEPHVTGDFSLRTKAPPTLISGTVFNMGDGNLCATCHQSLTAAATQLTMPGGQTNIKWASYSGSHHGPQSDILTGTNNWVYTKTAVTYAGPSPMYLQDSCKTCHWYGPSSGNLSGSLQLGGHGGYLTGDVHGSSKDIVAACQQCHNGTNTIGALPWPGGSTTFNNSGHNFGGTTPPSGVGTLTDDDLVQLNYMLKELLVYFGTGANFYTSTTALTPTAGAGQGPVVLLPSGDFPASATSWVWKQDWDFNPGSAYLNQWQSNSFWNLKIFCEDRSKGVHNPVFEGQILYDAIQNLIDNGATIYNPITGAVLAGGLGTRPS